MNLQIENAANSLFSVFLNSNNFVFAAFLVMFLVAKSYKNIKKYDSRNTGLYNTIQYCEEEHLINM